MLREFTLFAILALIIRADILRFLSGALVLLALLNVASAQIIPDTDSDLNALKAALATAKNSAKSCVRGSCAQFSCKEAIALSNALDDARIAMAVMQASLNQYFELHVKKQGELNEEFRKNAERDEKVRWALRWSKFFSNSGKLLLHAAAVTEVIKHIEELPELSEEGVDLGSSLVEALTLLGDMKGAIDAAEEGSNDIKTAIADKEGPITAEDQSAVGKLKETDKEFRELRDLTIETFNSSLKLRRAYTLYRSSPVKLPVVGTKPSPTPARIVLHSSLSGFGQIAGKLLLKVAEIEQSKLLEELKDIALVQKAIDQNYASIVQDTNRISNRFAKVQELRRFAAEVFFENYVCVAQCPNAPGLKILPDTAGKSYGEILKTYNAKLAGITSDITTAANKFVANDGTKPEISASPNRVTVDESVSAKFSLAVCKATEGAQVKLITVSSGEVTDRSLGDAKPGTQGSIQFKAPASPGDYAVQIVDQHSRVLASAGFSVVKPLVATNATWKVDAHANASLVTCVNSSWMPSRELSPAQWIWSQPCTATDNETHVFTASFATHQHAGIVKLEIAVDNGAIISINGLEAGKVEGFSSATTIDVTRFIHFGTNTITIKVKNYPGCGSFSCNPAGVLARLIEVGRQ